MIITSIKNAFRSVLGLFDFTMSTDDMITVWMPKFVRQVNANTVNLRKIAAKLESMIQKIKEKEKKDKERAKELSTLQQLQRANEIALQANLRLINIARGLK